MTVRFAIIIILILVFILGAYFVYQSFSSPKSPILQLSPKQKRQLEETTKITTDKNSYFERLKSGIQAGGPPKDGIPAVDNPQYTTIEEADKWLVSEDIVFGVANGDFIVAYPQRILVWHEIVSENINGEQVSITYCPLTGSAIGYKGKITPDIESTFGVSGKLINSNLVMYDRATNSYWPQIVGQAILGQTKGRILKEFSIIWTTWEKWKQFYPNTKVLSRKTGFFRDYGRKTDPYGSYLSDDRGYYDSDFVIFKSLNEDRRLPAKTVVIGIRDSDNHALAITKDKLRQEKTIEGTLGEKIVTISYDPNLDTHKAVLKESGEWINSFDVMWFAWVGFYPDTVLIK